MNTNKLIQAALHFLSLIFCIMGVAYLGKFSLDADWFFENNFVSIHSDLSDVRIIICRTLMYMAPALLGLLAIIASILIEILAAIIRKSK